MIITVGTYTFASWLRRGIGTRITQPDTLGAGASRRAPSARRCRSTSRSTARRSHKNFALIGPGDIIGINPQMVVRTEPRNWITELRAELPRLHRVLRRGFLWRYTPARPAARGSRPWLALLVLEDAERGQGVRDHRPPRAASEHHGAEARRAAAARQNWAWATCPHQRGPRQPDGVRGVPPEPARAEHVQRRQDHLPADQPAQARGRHRVPRVRRAGVRDGRLAGLDQDPVARRRAGAGLGPAAPTCELPDLLRVVFPHRRERGLRVAGEALEPRTVDNASASATWTARTRASGSRPAPTSA